MIRESDPFLQYIKRLNRLEKEIEALKADKPQYPVWSLKSIALSGNQDNYDFGPYTILFLSGAGPLAISGFANGVTGRVLILLWAGSSTLTLRHLSASSSTNNRMVIAGAADRVMNPFTSGNGFVVGFFWNGFWEEMWHSTP